MPGLETLYRFPVYQTREAYKQAIGKDAPAWDPSKPIKSWEDPNPPPMDDMGDVYYMALALGPDKKSPAVGSADSPNPGGPYLKRMRIASVDASRVNIPPKDFGSQTNRPDPGSLSPMASFDVPVPCRDLAADEELFFAWGGRAEVRKKQAAPVAVGGGTPASADMAEIRQLLLEVSSKLDIVLATRQQ